MLADHLKRLFINHHEWSICPDIARSIFQLGGTLDLFETKDNIRCHQFCSWAGHSLSSLMNTFLLPGSERICCMFPPPPIPFLHRVLCKIQQDKACVTLFAPRGPVHTGFHSSCTSQSVPHCHSCFMQI